MLATRGWGRDEFRFASPGFLATVRAALFAESGVGMLKQAQEFANVHVPDDAPLKARSEAMKLRVAGQKEVASLREALDLDG